MPELPEVETICRGITPYIVNQTVSSVIVRNYRLRQPIANDFIDVLTGAVLQSPSRRAKYLLIPSSKQTLICHLGMSGKLCVVKSDVEPLKHSHVDINLESGYTLRYTDPRRFGLLVLTNDPYTHPLLSSLGLEPLSNDFTGDYLYQKSRKRSMPIKNFIMTNQIVVGIGNIYATESLFAAKIHPQKPANQLTLQQYYDLETAIKMILHKSITAGGTTLRDYVQADGKLGYFAQKLLVYGKAGKPCPICQTTLEQVKIGGRSSVFCPQCQS